MTITAQSIIKDIQTALQDESGVRWPATEIAGYINDGQREIAVLRPEMFVVSAVLSLAAGAKQTLPAACIDFMDMPRLTSGGALTKTDRAVLDALSPGWYLFTQTASLKHFCYDPKTPQVVYTYPPAAASTSVDIVYSALPADIAAPSGAAWSTASGNISADDIFKNALFHYALFRAWGKDAEFGGNATLSATHYQLFKAGAASDVVPAVAVSPK